MLEYISIYKNPLRAQCGILFNFSLSIQYFIIFWRAAPPYKRSVSDELVEILGKTITDHDPIFFKKYKYKKKIMIWIVFPRSTKKGFYLL